MFLNKEKINKDKQLILNSLNISHTKNGYSTKELIDVLIISCKYECHLRFIETTMNYELLDIRSSHINTIGSVESFLHYLMNEEVLVRKVIQNGYYNPVERYFTINYEGYLKNKIRKEKLNKILKK